MSYTWIETHEGLVNYLASMRNNQANLINILKKAGIDHFNDEDPKGNKIPMTEIDPFTFFAYIYKHGGVKRLEILRTISRLNEINASEPNDTDGIPSSNAQRVWLFPYKYDRNEDEINRLWDFFEKVRTDQVTSKDFDETLKIKGVAIPKLTEAMFNVKALKYLPINKPVKNYIKNVLNIQDNPKNYSEYVDLLEIIKEQSNLNFPEISHEAYEYSSKNKKTTIEESHDDIIVVEDFKAKPTCDLNTILYGPPGTGKTYNTVIMAAEIVKGKDKVKDYEAAKIIFNDNLGDQIEFITFHQNYSYEDFIQGIRPDIKDENEQLKFKKSDGVFKVIADRAYSNIKESEKDLEEISQVKAFEDALEILKDRILESDEPIKINDTAYFTAVEDDAFRYSGVNWTLGDKGFNGFRMKYSDLERFFEEGVMERKEIKNLDNISGLAKQHATYFIKTFELVKSLMPNNSIKVQKTEKKNYVIIIDEINRANISRVFGELITLIEEDKRSHGDIPMRATLPSGDTFMVPSNLYIIGTMNTADKSIALLDIALRRRFTFVGMYPKYEIEDEIIHEKEYLRKNNEKIIESGKGRDFQLGHSYFMGKEFNLVSTLNNKVIPLLMEYFMNDEVTVIKLLEGSGFLFKKEASGKVYWPLEIESVKEEDGN